MGNPGLEKYGKLFDNKPFWGKVVDKNRLDWAAFGDREGLTRRRSGLVEGVMNQVRRRKQDEKDEQIGGEERKIPA